MKHRFPLLRFSWSLLVTAFALALVAKSVAQTNLHRFGVITPQPDGSIALKFLGAAPTAFRTYFDLYLLEASPELATWTLLRELPSAGALTHFTDSESAKRERQFYRVQAR